jgi:type II secretory pathway component GspD/PulD (secretin)
MDKRRVLICGTALLAVQAPPGMMRTAVAQAPVQEGVEPAYLHIDYQPGRFEARVQDAPLLEVLQAIEHRTGLQAIVGDAESAQKRVSARVEAQSLEQAIPQLLQGYSYAMYPTGDRRSRVLVVMSSRRYVAPAEVMPTEETQAGLQPVDNGMPSPLQAGR